MQIFRLLLALLLYAATSHAAPLSGRLAYVQNGAAYVMTLPNGKPQMLPNSRGVRLVSLAPVGGTVLYFVTQKGDTERVFVARPPYRSAQALPAPLDKFDRFAQRGLQWSGDAQTALFVASDKSYLWRPSSGKIEGAPGAFQAVLARDGKAMAYATEKELKVRALTTQREKVLFSSTRPEPMFAAVKRARNRRIAAELGETSPDTWKDSTMWDFGPLVFSADHKTLWFACNAGGGSGGGGNTTWCWFACDVKTGRLTVLERLGVELSRLPSDAQLSPNGQKLLFATSVHASGIDNPCWVTVLDLRTQKRTKVLSHNERKNADTNRLSGLCWSPRGDALAFSAVFYNTRVVKTIDKMLALTDYTLTIRDLKGRTLKTIRGATMPDWGK